MLEGRTKTTFDAETVKPLIFIFNQTYRTLQQLNGYYNSFQSSHSGEGRDPHNQNKTLNRNSGGQVTVLTNKGHNTFLYIWRCLSFFFNWKIIFT